MEEAALFLRAHLPAAVANRIEWPSLRLIETSFVDEALRDSESDLLYAAQMKESETECLLYLLFEHQSQPDGWMRFRLLKYMCRIWDESFKERPEQSELPPIVPVVFYQGERAWRYSTEFVELFAESVRAYDFLPRFAHYLIDQSGLAPEEVKGGLKAKVAQLLMMAAYQKRMQEALRLAAPLMAQLTRGGGLNYVAVFVVYLAATQERRVVNEFAAQVRQYAPETGGDMLTYAEELRQEGMQEGLQKGLQEGLQKGLQKGEIKGKVETIESLLAVGTQWSLITRATGITPEEFERLKAEVRGLKADRPLEGDPM
uniref:Rpn family recombination-promoting nuclease/putative transposase n=1 Tax=Caldilinea aerophila TaxID=133453 RepID=A0A7C1JX66_9CHLR